MSIIRMALRTDEKNPVKPGLRPTVNYLFDRQAFCFDNRFFR